MRTPKNPQTYFNPDEIETCDRERVKEIHQTLQEKIGDIEYPCVGAKASLNSNQYRLGIYGELGLPTTTHHLGADLIKYIKETDDTQSDYLTLIAVFTDGEDSELEFEKKLWMQIQMLHDSEKDKRKWDPHVSNDPEDADFSFSFDGTAFFIVGLHPNASRKARRFPFTALAFNLHRQFVKLRDNDQFERMKDVIRTRDQAYDGSVNPMLKDFGEGSEAAQYSGRETEKNWKCPFLAGFTHQVKK
jgi:uncharacterized protein